MPSPTTETNSASTTTSSAAAAADSTSPATATSLETDLLTHLASTSALDDIHTNLLCYLQRMGWTEKIRTLSLELLRAGRCERFDEVVDAVIASAECRPHPAFDLSNQDPTVNGSGPGHAKGSARNGSGNANNTGSNGSTGKNSNGNGNGSGGSGGMGLSADAEAYLENVDVRIPTVVVEHGVRMVKDVLKDVVSWEDGSSLDEGLDQSTGGQATTTSKGAVSGTAGSSSSTSGKKLDKDKDKDKDKDDAGNSSKKNGDVSSSSPVKKTAKKSNPAKTGK